MELTHDVICPLLLFLTTTLVFQSCTDRYSCVVRGTKLNTLFRCGGDVMLQRAKQQCHALQMHGCVDKHTQHSAQYLHMLLMGGMSTCDVMVAILKHCTAGMQVPGFFLAIDGQHKLAEVGWLQIPYLIHLAWAAQWLQYTSKLHKRLRREDEDGQGSLVIPLFEGAPLSPDGGYLRRSIKLPPLQQLKAYKHFSVEMALTCGGGGLDRDCPAWDHVIQMFVCCDDPPGGRPCDPCAITPWLVAGSRSRPNMYPRHPGNRL